MVQQLSKSDSQSEIVYPDSDGQPMADNTEQFQWIVTIKENLERLYADDPNVFVAGDLLWYPVEGQNKLRAAPDAMVAFEYAVCGDGGNLGDLPPGRCAFFDVCGAGSAVG